MSGTNRIGNAFPTGGSTSPDTIRHALAAGLVNSIDTADDIEDIDFSESGKDAVPDIVICRDTLIAYGRDPTNPADAHSPPTTLRSADGKVFKSTLAAAAFVNVIDIVAAPAGGESAGDKYLVSASPSGAFASYANRLVFLNGAGDWVSCIAEIGQRVYVRDEAIDYQYQEDGTWAQASAVASGGIGARELAFPWGMVAASETATPPGTRATGATPTMPLGGTAANINDDNTATTGTTSALGDLSAAAVNARIFAKLDLGADTPLAGIEAKLLAASTGSSSSGAMGFYYATEAAPTTWTQIGAGFTLTTTATTFSRSGDFTARYIGIATEAKDWSTATHSLKALNAYKQATSIADGVKYIVAANGIGVFSGHDTEVAEAWDGAFRFYTPYANAEIFVDDIVARRRFTGSEWISASGIVIGHTYFVDDTGSLTQQTGGGFSYGNTPTTSIARVVDDNILTYAAKSVGAKLRLSYNCDVTLVVSASGPGSGNHVLAVYRDNETDAIAYRRAFRDSQLSANTTFEFTLNVTFIIDAIDDQEHNYQFALTKGTGSGGTTPTLLSRVGQIEELTG